MKSRILSVLFVSIVCLSVYSQQTGSASIHILQNPYNDRFYYINRDGRLLYRSITNHPFSEGLAFVDNSDEVGGKMGFIDTQGRMVFELSAIAVWPFSEGLTAFQDKNYKWGYVNKQGDIVLDPQFDEVGPFMEGLAMVKKGSKWGYINTRAELVIPHKFGYAGDFVDGLARVGAYVSTLKYGFIDKRGNYVIEPQYDQVSDFNGGHAWVGKGWKDGHNRYGIIDTKGNLLTEIKYYTNMYTPPPPDFKYGLLWTMLKDVDTVSATTRVLIDIKGNERAIYENIRSISGFTDKVTSMMSDIDTSNIYVDFFGNKLPIKEFGRVVEFSEGLAAVKADNGLVGYINKQGGEYVIPPQFTEARWFKNGMAIVTAGNKMGIINKKGEYVLEPKYDFIGSFSQGRLPFTLNGKSGYLSTELEEVIGPEYPNCGMFSNGLARVGTQKWDPQQGDVWVSYKYIDADGNIFWDPKNEPPLELRNEITEQSTIAVPGNYDPNYKYPVIFVFPYTGGTAASLATTYIGGWRDENALRNKLSATISDLYPQREKEHSFIFVFTPGVGSTKDHSWEGFSAAIERYEKVVDRDIAILKDRYSINENRIILMGYSLGGDLSWALCNRQPERFKGALIAGSRCSYSQQGSIAAFARRDCRFYIAMGEYEQEVRITGAKNAKALLDASGVKNMYYAVPKGGHVELPKAKFKEALDFVLFH